MDTSRYIDLHLRVVDQSPSGWLIETPKGNTWVDRFQVDRNDDGTVTMPRALARHLGLHP